LNYQFINPETIYQYFGDDDNEMLLEMIQIILQTNLRDLKEMDKAYGEEDFASIKKRCHKSKPSLSYIGALTTRKLVEEIELNVPQSQELFKSLKAQVVQIEQELLHFIANVEE
jgi:HPt (histidine-containing phosphotransfer) domain-containing protein